MGPPGGAKAHHDPHKAAPSFLHHTATPSNLVQLRRNVDELPERILVWQVRQTCNRMEVLMREVSAEGQPGVPWHRNGCWSRDAAN